MKISDFEKFADETLDLNTSVNTMGGANTGSSEPTDGGDDTEVCTDTKNGLSCFKYRPLKPIVITLDSILLPEGIKKKPTLTSSMATSSIRRA